MRRRVLAMGVAGVVILGGLAGCPGPGGGGPATPSPGGTGALGGASSTPIPVATTGPALAAPLTCAQLQEAAVTTATVKLSDYPFDSINLTGGRWSAEDGTEITLEEACGIGDLVGDPSADAVGVIKLTAGGTGRFYTIVVWRNNGGSPVLAATLAIGDRNPVTDISIASHHATVVYLTRTDDQPMAVLNVKRTVIYTVTGTTLHEVSHVDAPYTP